MKGYKGFEKGLICRGKQYAENTVFEEERAEICKNGMHFCENPFDVLDHYPLVDDKGEISDFAEVEALDKVKTDDNKKFCTKKLKIGAKISFARLVQASVNFEYEKTKSEAKPDSENIKSSGDDAQIGSSGDDAQIKSSGKYSVVNCAGHNCAVSAKIGSWITLAEWKWSDEEKMNIPVCVKTEKVDGVRIKEDTFYKLINGEFTEAEG